MQFLPTVTIATCQYTWTSTDTLELRARCSFMSKYFIPVHHFFKVPLLLLGRFYATSLRALSVSITLLPWLWHAKPLSYVLSKKESALDFKKMVQFAPEDRAFSIAGADIGQTGGTALESDNTLLIDRVTNIRTLIYSATTLYGASGFECMISY